MITRTGSTVTMPSAIISSSTGRKASIFSGVVDDLDDHRQVLRQAQDLGRVDAAVGAVAEVAAQHGGAGEVPLARRLHDRLVERLVVIAVAVADEDSQQLGALRQMHRFPLP